MVEVLFSGTCLLYKKSLEGMFGISPHNLSYGFLTLSSWPIFFKKTHRPTYIDEKRLCSNHTIVTIAISSSILYIALFLLSDACTNFINNPFHLSPLVEGVFHHKIISYHLMRDGHLIFKLYT